MHISDVAMECAHECARLSRECRDKDIGFALFQISARLFSAATHDAELYQVEIDDSSLLSPRDGRIEYRVANVGEVLPAGGKVFTILDTSYVYMDVYLPAPEAGKSSMAASPIPPTGFAVKMPGVV